MSLYNMLHGVNPMAGILLGILGRGSGDFSRFRDIYLTEHEGDQVIAVYTRNGGGNRECYDDDCAGDCTGCVMTNVIPAMDGYITDFDDDFDCTYATILFRVSGCAESTLKDFALLIDGKTPTEKQMELIDKLQNGCKEDPQVAKAMEAMSPLLSKIAESIAKG